MAVSLRWSGLNTSLEHSQSELSIAPPPKNNLVPMRKTNTPSYYINQKRDQRYELPPWVEGGGCCTGPTLMGQEGRMTSAQTFLFSAGAGSLSQPCSLELV